jgi:hypothetical protein
MTGPVKLPAGADRRAAYLPDGGIGHRAVVLHLVE